MSFWNAVRASAAQMDQQRGVLRWGLVTSVDPVGYRVKVTIQPEGVQTAWLPLLSHAAGPGWSGCLIPDIGQQAALMADSGDGGNMVVLGFAHSTADTPPAVPNTIGTGGVVNATTAPNVAGEYVLRSKSGGVIRLCADGSIYMQGTLRLDGTLIANGDVFDRHGSLDRLRQNYDAHGHPYYAGVSPSTTSTTDHPDPE